MEKIALILSGLALLAAIYSLALTVRNEKRSQKRNTALVKYVDTAFAEAREMSLKETEHRVKVCDSFVERIEKLENGITPDYEQAKAAAHAVNDFNKGISNLLGFDPYEALRANRNKEAGESE